MVRPPRRMRASWEWRVKQPPPEQGAWWTSWKARERRKARTNATNALRSLISWKEVDGAWKSTVMVRFWRVGWAAWPMGHLHLIRHHQRMYDDEDNGLKDQGN